MLLPAPPPQAPPASEPFVAEASAEGLAALERLEFDEDLRATLFAAEPLLANPVAFHVDNRGVFYVCESFRVHAGVTDMREHMDWLADELDNLTVEDRVAMLRRQEGEAGFARYALEEERIRRIEDRDGDGAADFAQVFAGGFRDPADGIAAGVLAYRDEVFYTCIPSLWRLGDRDGDGAAEERERVSSGYGVHIALLGHDMHGLAIGLDGRLYWSIGDRGLNVEHDGQTLALPHEGAVLRCELDGSGLELVHRGLRNPQELAFDDRGDLFTGDNNSDGGDRARWVQIVPGADSGWRFYYQYVNDPVARGPWNDERLWEPQHAGQPAYIVPPIANLADGPAGLEHDPGTGMPERYRGHFFLCDFRGDASSSGIHAFAQVERGAGFELGPVERLVWKTLATDCQIGPDGALYLSDWTHGWNKTGKGRIFRLAAAGEPDALALETRALLLAGFADLDVTRLAALLEHADRRVRQEAHLELAWRAEAQPLARAATSGKGRARLHGIFGLGLVARRRNAEHTDIDGVLLPLLGDADADVRAAAAEVLGDLEVVEAAPGLLELLGDPSARVRARAALALGKIGVPHAYDALLTLAGESGGDAVLRHACVEGLLGCLRRDPAARREPASRDERMADLLVARRRRDARVASYLADPDALLVREAASAIYDEPIATALPALADCLARPAAADDSAAFLRRALYANLRLGDAARAQAVAGFAADGARPEALRVEALRLLECWADPPDVDGVLGCHAPLAARPADGVPSLVAALAPALSAGDGPIAHAWIELAGKVRADSAPVLAEIARDRKRAGTTRALALRSLAWIGGQNLRRCAAEALAEADGLVRAAGIELLAALEPGEALPLVERVLADGELAERRAGYRLLAGARGHEADLLLAGELEKLALDLLPAELALDLLLAAEESDGPEVQAALERRRASRSADPELAPWLDGLFGGDPGRGRELFWEKSELACLRCHRSGTGGAPSVGPDLTGIGARLSRLQLLEAVVAPSRRIALGFSTETFFLHEGAIHAGRVVEENAEVTRIVGSDGALIELQRADVEERQPGLSAMPMNLGEFLSRSELRDLLAYLATL